MNLKDYRAKLTQIPELYASQYVEKAIELEMEYLSEQAVPDAETAIRLIREAQERGDLPELEDDAEPEDWDCELLELLDDESPDDRIWRCENGNYMIDVVAETGEVIFISG